MLVKLHIHHVEILNLGGEHSPSRPKPRRHGMAAGIASNRRPAIQPTCKGMNLAWPNGKEEISAPPMSMLRAAIAKPCQTCSGTGQITYNPSDEVGQFETAPCPSCSQKRRPE